MKKRTIPNYSLIHKLFRCLTSFRKRIWAVSGCLFLVTAISFLQPLVLRRITDEGMVNGDLRIIVTSTVMLMLLVAAERSIEMVQVRLFADIHNESRYMLFHKAFDKMLHLKTSYFDEKGSAEIAGTLAMDVGNVASVTDRYNLMSVSYVFSIISGVAGLFFISWKLALVVLALVPVKYYIVRHFSLKKEAQMKDMISLNRDFSAWFGDAVSGICEIKLWGLFGRTLGIFKEKQEKLMENTKKGTMLDAWKLFFEIMIEYSVTCLLYILGGILICSGKLSIGSVFAFISYSNYVTSPVSAVMNIRYNLSRILPSAERFFAFMELEEEPTGVMRLEMKQYSQNQQASEPEASLKAKKEAEAEQGVKIEFDRVSYSYIEGIDTLREISFCMKPGEKVAIIGNNGSGKTTILNLLLRFHRPSEGKILINGQNSDEIALEDYRRFFSVVSQDACLFNDTVYNNICLEGDAVQSYDRVMEACRKSGAADFITKLPEGFESHIGRNGAMLSGGEKQKLAAARAIYKDAPVFVFDEATSGYDVSSDAYLHRVMLDELKTKSVLMITHHPDNLEGMDSVYRLENGRLIKQ